MSLCFVFVHTMEVDGDQNSLVINILHNIVLFFPQKKVNLTYLKRHEILMSKWWQKFQLNKWIKRLHLCIIKCNNGKQGGIVKTGVERIQISFTNQDSCRCQRCPISNHTLKFCWTTYIIIYKHACICVKLVWVKGHELGCKLQASSDGTLGCGIYSWTNNSLGYLLWTKTKQH